MAEHVAPRLVLILAGAHLALTPALLQAPSMDCCIYPHGDLMGILNCFSAKS